MDRNDYYELLGISSTASGAAIRRAFQKLARKYHPDLNPGDNVARLRYERIYEAYEVLTDPDRRGRYDEAGERPQSRGELEPPRFGFEGFDFSREGSRASRGFPELFRVARTRDTGGDERGEDVHHNLKIGFEESLEGITATFPLARHISCQTCEGFKDIPSSRSRPCEACGGRGRATQAHGFMLFAKPCLGCGGKGVVAKEPCPECRGAGRSVREESVSVDVPCGVQDGDRIVVAGKGHEGRGAAHNGDLHIHVHVEPHPIFTRKGDNLFCTVPITFTEAALGGRVAVPTPDGEVKLRVPPGVQSGQKLRLSERGAPSRLGAMRGDLFVVVKVVTPRLYDDRSRELLRELDRLNPMNPREEMHRGPEEAER